MSRLAPVTSGPAGTPASAELVPPIVDGPFGEVALVDGESVRLPASDRGGIVEERVQAIGGGVDVIVRDGQPHVVPRDPDRHFGVGRSRVQGPGPSRRQRAEELRRHDNPRPLGAQAEQVQIGGLQARQEPVLVGEWHQSDVGVGRVTERRSSASRKPRAEKQKGIASPERSRQTRARRRNASNWSARPMFPSRAGPAARGQTARRAPRDRERRPARPRRAPKAPASPGRRPTGQAASRSCIRGPRSTRASYARYESAIKRRATGASERVAALPPSPRSPRGRGRSTNEPGPRAGTPCATRAPTPARSAGSNPTMTASK